MFKTGLLAARGQIAFILALAFATAVIIYLENLDTETRIQGRVEAALAERQRAPEPNSAARNAASVSLREAERAHAADPRLPANQAALLTALSTAARTGLLPTEEAFSRVSAVLDGIGTEPPGDSPALVAALALTAATFPTLQERLTRMRIFA